MENNNQKKNDGKFPGGSTWGVLAILMLVTFLAVSFMNDYWKKSKSEALSYTCLLYTSHQPHGKIHKKLVSPQSYLLVFAEK